MSKLVIIAHDIRSSHNVGALLRTADGFGARVYLTGYTPYPETKHDRRLPHIVDRLTAQIHKTALGAEKDTKLWAHHQDISELLEDLLDDEFEIVGLEQAAGAIKLPDYQPVDKVAILLGREVEGIAPELLAQCHKVIEIPMRGRKESFNVVQAAAVALYHCTFYPF